MTTTTTSTGPLVTKSTTSIIISFSGIGETDHVGVILLGETPRAFVGRANVQPHGPADATPIRVMLERVLAASELRQARFVLIGDSITPEQLYVLTGIDDIVPLNAVMYVSVGVDLLPLLGLRQTRDEPMPTDAMLIDRVRQEVGEGPWSWDIDQAWVVAIALAGALKLGIEVKRRSARFTDESTAPEELSTRGSDHRVPDHLARGGEGSKPKRSRSTRHQSTTAGDADLLSPTQVASRLGLARCTVYRMIDSGELPRFLVRRRIRIARSDLEEHLRKRRISSADELATHQRRSITILKQPTNDLELEGRAAAAALGLVREPAG